MSASSYSPYQNQRGMGSEMYDKYGGQYYHDMSPAGGPYTPYVVQAGNLSGDGSDAFANQTPIVPNRSTQVPTSPQTKENTHRLVGYTVGIASVCAEHVLSHPCIVLRRQCQVNHSSKWYHLTPVTLFQVIFNIQRHQSMTTLWKGIGSKFMVKGITAASETAISEFSPLPKEVTRHSPIKKHVMHLVLEGLSIMVTTPFFAASLVETVQSEIASERPGVLDCLREGVARLVGWSSSQTTRLLPVWKLVTPVVVYGLCHYVVSSLAKYTVLLSLKHEIIEDKEQRQEDVGEQTIYETYYPELIATFTGNLLADTVLFPMETVMHRLLLQGTRTIIDNTDTGLGVMPIITRYEGFMDCFTTMVNEEGVLGFYKGLGSLLLQYGLHMGILRLTKLILLQLSQQTRDTASLRRTLSHTRFASTATQMTPQPQAYPMSLRHRASEPATMRGFPM